MVDNDLIMDHYENPRNLGVIEDPDAEAADINPVCGDALRLMLKIRDGRIVDAKYQISGCWGAVAAMSAASEMIIGMTLPEAEALNRDDFSAALGGLPPSKLHGSILAADVLQRALASYSQKHTAR